MLARRAKPREPLALWLVVNPFAWGDYDAAVVAAETQGHARLTHPLGPSMRWTGAVWLHTGTDGQTHHTPFIWPAPADLEVTLIGYALADREPGIIVSDSGGR